MNTVFICIHVHVYLKVTSRLYKLPTNVRVSKTAILTAHYKMSPYKVHVHVHVCCVYIQRRSDLRSLLRPCLLHSTCMTFRHTYIHVRICTLRSKQLMAYTIPMYTALPLHVCKHIDRASTAIIALIFSG